MNYKLPECAKCGRPVDEMHRWHGASTDEMVFVAQCHGSRQVVRIHLGMVQSGFNLTVGQAFVEPLLVEGMT